MTYIIKRDTEYPLYVSGYSPELGNIIVGNTYYDFVSKDLAVDVAKTLNNLALLQDDPYRYKVYKLSLTSVKTTPLAEGDGSSAYNKRVGKPSVEHDVEIGA